MKIITPFIHFTILFSTIECRMVEINAISAGEMIVQEGHVSIAPAKWDFISTMENDNMDLLVRHVANAEKHVT